MKIIANINRKNKMYKLTETPNKSARDIIFIIQHHLFFRSKQNNRLDVLLTLTKCQEQKCLIVDTFYV